MELTNLSRSYKLLSLGQPPGGIVPVVIHFVMLGSWGRISGPRISQWKGNILEPSHIPKPSILEVGGSTRIPQL